MSVLSWIRGLVAPEPEKMTVQCFYCPQDPIIDYPDERLYNAVLDHLESADHLIRAKQWKDTHDAH